MNHAKRGKAHSGEDEVNLIDDLDTSRPPASVSPSKAARDMYRKPMPRKSASIAGRLASAAPSPAQAPKPSPPKSKVPESLLAMRVGGEQHKPSAKKTASSPAHSVRAAQGTLLFQGGDAGSGGTSDFATPPLQKRNAAKNATAKIHTSGEEGKTLEEIFPGDGGSSEAEDFTGSRNGWGKREHQKPTERPPLSRPPPQPSASIAEPIKINTFIPTSKSPGKKKEKDERERKERQEREKDRRKRARNDSDEDFEEADDESAKAKKKDATFTVGSASRGKAKKAALEETPLRIIRTRNQPQATATIVLSDGEDEQPPVPAPLPPPKVGENLKMLPKFIQVGSSAQLPCPKPVEFHSDNVELHVSSESLGQVYHNAISYDHIKRILNADHAPYYFIGLELTRPNEAKLHHGEGGLEKLNFHHADLRHRCILLWFEAPEGMRSFLHQLRAKHSNVFTTSMFETVRGPELEALLPNSDGPRTRSQARAAGPASIVDLSDMPNGPVLPILSYPPDAPNGITITTADVERLAPGEFLNDSIIDFYLRYLMRETFRNRKDSVYIFSSFFYSKLSSDKDILDKVPASIHRWTKNEDIFKYQLVVVPINDKAHWSVAIICNAGKVPLQKEAEKNGDREREKKERNAEDTGCVILFDSLNLHAKYRIAGDLRNYLTAEWKEKAGRYAQLNAKAGHTPAFHYTINNLPHYQVQVPTQNNSSDCGLFLLKYVEQFLSEGQPVSKFVESKNHSDWFPVEEATNMRSGIRSVIDRLRAHAMAAAEEKEAAGKDRTSEDASKEKAAEEGRDKREKQRREKEDAERKEREAKEAKEAEAERKEREAMVEERKQKEDRERERETKKAESAKATKQNGSSAHNKRKSKEEIEEVNDSFDEKRTLRRRKSDDAKRGVKAGAVSVADDDSVRSEFEIKPNPPPPSVAPPSPLLGSTPNDDDVYMTQDMALDESPPRPEAPVALHLSLSESPEDPGTVTPKLMVSREVRNLLNTTEILPVRPRHMRSTEVLQPQHQEEARGELKEREHEQAKAKETEREFEKEREREQAKGKEQAKEREREREQAKKKEREREREQARERERRERREREREREREPVREQAKEREKERERDSEKEREKRRTPPRRREEAEPQRRGGT